MAVRIIWELKSDLFVPKFNLQNNLPEPDTGTYEKDVFQRHSYDCIVAHEAVRVSGHVHYIPAEFKSVSEACCKAAGF